MVALQRKIPSGRVARTTGLLYLGLAVAGLVGFLFIRPQLFVAGDAAATLGRLVEHEGIARAGIAFELLIVLTQALTGVWFYRLFREVDAVAAGSIAAFGLVNAVAILLSAALLATATDVALHPVGDAAASVQLLYLVSGHLWTVGELFFGLWLIPMGWCVLRSGWMPRALGWILIGGGVGYVLSPFVGYLLPRAHVLADLLPLPASVGEFWIIGYLLIRGLRPRAEGPATEGPATEGPATEGPATEGPATGGPAADDRVRVRRGGRGSEPEPV